MWRRYGFTTFLSTSPFQSAPHLAGAVETDRFRHLLNAADCLLLCLLLCSLQCANAPVTILPLVPGGRYKHVLLLGITGGGRHGSHHYSPPDFSRSLCPTWLDSLSLSSCSHLRVSVQRIFNYEWWTLDNGQRLQLPLCGPLGRLSRCGACQQQWGGMLTVGWGNLFSSVDE